jgi:ATP-dependent helicase/nuclease subunit B
MTASNRHALSQPIDPPEVPTVEIVSSTRRDEVRAAMAVVASLRGHGVPIRDIVVVVRDLDAYEEPLFRAAVQYGLTPVFWTQLRVTRTRPYALIKAVCDVLDEERVDVETLLRPLELCWSPRSIPGQDGQSMSMSRQWPIDPAAVSGVREWLPDERRTISEWVNVVEASEDVDRRFRRFVKWLADAPTPEPESVSTLLGDVIEGYAEHGLPKTKAGDSPALLETETDARAVVRVRTLVRQLRHKFADRIEEGTVDQSWGDVADLASVIATQRPGRREHSNARALDVLEANDVWALDVPYVVAVGLTADQWPQPPESVLPPEFQEAVLQGDGQSGLLAPQPAWIGGRDRDQFSDTLRAAGQCVVVTRYTQTREGNEVHPSPLLGYLNTERVGEKDRDLLVGTDRQLPPEIRGVVTAETGGWDE